MGPGQCPPRPDPPRAGRLIYRHYTPLGGRGRGKVDGLGSFNRSREIIVGRGGGGGEGVTVSNMLRINYLFKRHGAPNNKKIKRIVEFHLNDPPPSPFVNGKLQK